jgi:cytoskeletal protein RodZ
VSPVVVGIGVALVAAVVIWLMACVQRRPPSEEAQQIVDDARNEAKSIVAAAEAKATEIAESAERRAAETTSAAEASAAEIIHEAEEKSWDLVAAGELQRTLARREALRVQELADGVRSELKEMASDLLAEVEEMPGAWSDHGHEVPDGGRRVHSEVGST